MSIRKTMTAALVAILMTSFGAASASTPTVEIIALPHWPVQKALVPVRAMLGKYKGKIQVVERNAEEPEGIRQLQAAGFKGHVPILIRIDGKYDFKRPNGTAVRFENFPAASTNPMGPGGTWTEADVEAAITERLK